MSEEQQASAQAPLLCASGCGFYGNPTTLDMCSVCYRQHCLLNGTATGPSSSASAAASTKTVASAASAATVVNGGAATASCFAPSTAGAKGAAEAAGADASSSSSTNPEAAVEKKARANRCASCKKKVGLTGFACRCGATYCGTHRYPEKHACVFDFKGSGRDAIARANPVIKGEKLTDKI